MQEIKLIPEYYELALSGVKTKTTRFGIKTHTLGLANLVCVEKRSYWRRSKIVIIEGLSLVSGIPKDIFKLEGFNSEEGFRGALLEIYGPGIETELNTVITFASH